MGGGWGVLVSWLVTAGGGGGMQCSLVTTDWGGGGGGGGGGGACQLIGYCMGGGGLTQSLQTLRQHKIKRTVRLVLMPCWPQKGTGCDWNSVLQLAAILTPPPPPPFFCVDLLIAEDIVPKMLSNPEPQVRKEWSVMVHQQLPHWSWQSWSGDENAKMAIHRGGPQWLQSNQKHSVFAWTSWIDTRGS